jgi:hypothetical protein
MYGYFEFHYYMILLFYKNTLKMLLFQAKEKLENIINNYIYVQIHMAGKAICIAAQNKIADEDVILTYG